MGTSIENLRNVCRLCANTHEQMIPIYNAEGLEHGLEVKINSLLPFISLSKGRNILPDQVCYTCASTLLVFSDLLERSMKTDEDFKLMLSDIINKNKASKTNKRKSQGTKVVLYTRRPLNNPTILSIKPITQPRIVDQKPSSTSVPNQSGVLTFNKFTSNAERLKELPLKNVTQSDQNKNPIQQQPLSATKSLDNKKIDLIDLTIDPSKESSDKNVSTVRVPCIKDDKKQHKKKKKTDEIRYQPSRHERPMAASSPVPRDPVSVPNNQPQPSIIDHTYTMCHPKSAVAPTWLNCEKCSRRFRVALRLREHLAKCNGRGKSGVKKYDRRTYDRFRVEADGEVFYKCNLCNYCSTSKNNPTCFANHYRRHTTGFDVKCVQCPRKFRTRAAMQRHVDVVHLGRKDFQCPVCGKTFAERNTLKTHLLIHTDERPLVCHECGKRFRHVSKLNVHVRFVHKKEKNIKCPECGKMYCTGEQLRNHMRRHAGIREFVCQVCNKGFLTRKTMVEHATTVHGNARKYECSICNRAFKAKRTLITHMKTHRVVGRTEITPDKEEDPA
ncbi:zinc finger protein 425-like isoform X2 [Adelges cooleyi]|uniref:zinc finger protein 425-like isoform X2 n=1 Tax=Adelges cooleyi TaxID=133065 RepID=UPI00217F7B8D|nr:zinc finger protein 425-like isoform X2 [Adelges cooleyi]